jgi:hypothetical protein
VGTPAHRSFFVYLLPVAKPARTGNRIVGVPLSTLSRINERGLKPYMKPVMRHDHDIYATVEEQIHLPAAKGKWIEKTKPEEIEQNTDGTLSIELCRL